MRDNPFRRIITTFTKFIRHPAHGSSMPYHVIQDPSTHRGFPSNLALSHFEAGREAVATPTGMEQTRDVYVHSDVNGRRNESSRRKEKLHFRVLGSRKLREQTIPYVGKRRDSLVSKFLGQLFLTPQPHNSLFSTKIFKITIIPTILTRIFTANAVPCLVTNTVTD